jgi:hypothetical protein
MRTLATGRLLQSGVLGFGLFQDGDVGVGVFPQGEEVVVCGFRLGGIACHRVSTTELEVSQYPQWAVRDEAAMVEEFLKLLGGFIALVQKQIRWAAHISGV